MATGRVQSRRRSAGGTSHVSDLRGLVRLEFLRDTVYIHVDTGELLHLAAIAAAEADDCADGD